MAEHEPEDRDLIEGYLDRVRSTLPAQADADDVIAELRDHLLTAADRHQVDGLAAADARRRAITELGEPSDVGAAFARNRRGTPAVPTTLTRTAGVAGIAAAAGAAIAVGGFALGAAAEDAAGEWSTAAQAWDAVGSIGVLSATAGLLGLLVGVVRRHGGLGIAGHVATALGALGAAVSVLAWAVPVWSSLVLLSWTAVVVATRSERVAPRSGTLSIAAGLALLVSAALASGGTLVPDAATVWGGIAGAALAATGAAFVGRWLVSEVPAGTAAIEV